MVNPLEALKRLRRDKALFAEAVAGIKLNEAQRRFLLLSGRVRVRVAGRRFGKTTLTALDVLHEAITKPGSRVLIVGPSLDQARVYFELFEEWASRSPLVALFIKEKKRTPYPLLKLANGSVITARSAARGGRYIRGRGYTHAVVTEASFVPDDVYYAALRPALAENPRARLDLEGTPWSKGSFFYELFLKGQADGEYFSSARFTSYDAPHLSKEELERIRAEVPEEYFRVEFLAEFRDEGDELFPRDLVLRATEDYRLPERPEPGKSYVIGVDVAKKVDYTVITVLEVSGKPWKIAEFSRFKGVPYSRVAELVRLAAEKYRARVFLDTTGVGEAVLEGVPGAKGVVITQRVREELLWGLRLALERGDLLLPAGLRVLLEELKHFGRAAHDDCVFSLALAVWGAKRGRGWWAWREAV